MNATRADCGQTACSPNSPLRSQRKLEPSVFCKIRISFDSWYKFHKLRTFQNSKKSKLFNFIDHSGPYAFTAEIIQGLETNPPEVSPRYLYDALGSQLFTAITELPEYYPTRTEHAIFEKYGAAIAASTGIGRTLVDLGAGDCAKAAQLSPQLKPAHYVAIDIAADYLRKAADGIAQRFPAMQVTAIAMDFFSGLEWPASVPASQLLFFYPGSSIGNFSPSDAEHFLRTLSQIGSGSDLLIGVDLVKSTAVLEAAYDDALGVTACFNLNLLLHLNRLIGSDFNVRQFRHRAVFNHEQSRIEMSLVARTNQLVRWQGGERYFSDGDALLTEYSYKYRQNDFLALLQRAGFVSVQCWQDDHNNFMVCHAKSI